MAKLSIRFSLLRVLVKLTGITNTSLNRWYIWRINILLGQPLPGDFSKPLMVLDTFCTTMSVSESFCQVGGNQPLKQVLGIRMNVWRVLDATLQDILVDFHGGPAIPERCEAAQHFENQYAK